mmetsp:Transcript_16528/g.42159  ORF Transcript_16528/g.42159 Transcript_16528/m.42159 type:complete len:212 (-) Transcript_16528:292-927(-)
MSSATSGQASTFWRMASTSCLLRVASMARYAALACSTECEWPRRKRSSRMSPDTSSCCAICSRSAESSIRMRMRSGASSAVVSGSTSSASSSTCARRTASEPSRGERLAAMTPREDLRSRGAMMPATSEPAMVTVRRSESLRCTSDKLGLGGSLGATSSPSSARDSPPSVWKRLSLCEGGASGGGRPAPVGLACAASFTSSRRPSRCGSPP